MSKKKTLQYEDRMSLQFLSYPILTFVRYGLDWVDVNNPELFLTVPDYQREFVWEEERYVSYIRSIFHNNMPLTPVYIDTRREGEWMIIDGKHRIRAITRFVNDDLIVDGMKYSDLAEIDRRAFGMVILPTYDVKHLNEKEIVELYLMLNFKAVPHTEQDREKAEDILDSLTTADEEANEREK